MYKESLSIFQKLLNINPNNRNYSNGVEVTQSYLAEEKAKNNLFSSFQDVREKKK